MGDLMAALEYARAYIDNLLVITKGSHDDHLDKLEQVFISLCDAHDWRSIWLIHPSMHKKWNS